VDTNRIKELIDWCETGDGMFLCSMDWDKYLGMPLMEAFGDDVEEILAYLDEMDVDDLDTISGCFEDIYGKFTTDEVWDALEKLEEKIEKESTRAKASEEGESSTEEAGNG